MRIKWFRFISVYFVEVRYQNLGFISLFQSGHKSICSVSYIVQHSCLIFGTQFKIKLGGQNVSESAESVCLIGTLKVITLKMTFKCTMQAKRKDGYNTFFFKSSFVKATVSRYSQWAESIYLSSTFCYIFVVPEPRNDWAHVEVDMWTHPRLICPFSCGFLIKELNWGNANVWDANCRLYAYTFPPISCISALSTSYPT